MTICTFENLKKKKKKKKKNYLIKIKKSSESGIPK